MTNPEVPNTLIPLADSCRLLGGITRPTLDTLVKRGEVTKVNVGRRAFITSASLNAYIGRMVAAAASKATR